jgi:recombination protein RecT
MTEKNEIQVKQKYGITDVKNIGDSVNNKVAELVEKGRLTLPNNYSLGNAISSAYLILQETKDKNDKPVLEVCSKESIANSLLNMAILGLNPAKKQCYFIAYGNQLQLFVSYFGKSATIKRLKNIISEPVGTLIYAGDELEIGFNELGERLVMNHKTSWKAQQEDKIEGCYATVHQQLKNGQTVTRSALLTMKEIKEAWSKSKTSKDHPEFTGEFCKRTAINRLVKMILQTSNDDDLVADTLLETEYEHYDFNDTEEKIESRITTNANTGEVIGIDEEPKVKEDLKAKANFEEKDMKEIEEEYDDPFAHIEPNEENDPY